MVAGKVEDQAKGPVAFESIVFVINQVRECVLSSNVLSPADFRSPAVLLSGTVDYQMYNSFRDQFGRAPTTGLVVIELSTLGGDPEVARMMGEDVRYHSDLDPGRHFVFLGKAAASGSIDVAEDCVRLEVFLLSHSRIQPLIRKEGTLLLEKK